MERQTVMILHRSEVVVEEIHEDRQRVALLPVKILQAELLLAIIRHEITLRQETMEHEQIPEETHLEERMKVEQQHEDEQVEDEVEDLALLPSDEVEVSTCVVMVLST